MGLFRLLLALAVVLTHTGSLWGLELTGGVASVQTFFIISGFYMALILNEKYIGVGSYRLFLTNRFLRLFPVYWIVMVATIIMSIIAWLWKGNAITLTPYITFWNALDGPSKIFLTCTNLLIIGQDLTLFLGLDKLGTLYPILDFRLSTPPVYQFLLIPQAWSLSVELMFYVIAPFIVIRNALLIIALILISVALRYYLYVSYELYYDPWNYRFFPTELAMFLLGALGYRFYLRIKNLDIRKLSRAITFLLITSTVLFQFFPDLLFPSHFSLKYCTYYLFVVVSIPFAFAYSKDNRLDRYLGELSYPIYISHLLIVVWAGLVGLHYPVVVVLVTVLLSIFLLRCVIEPIDKFRASRA